MPDLSTAQWINLVVDVILPAVVALVTAREAHPGLKSTILFILSTLSGSLTSVLQATSSGVPLTWNNVATTVLIGFATAILAHFGVLKPANITGSTGRIATRIPAGVGGTHAGKHEKD